MIFEINLLKDRVKQQKRRSFLRAILYVELSLFLITFIVLGSYRLSLYYKFEDIQRKLVMLNEDIVFLSKEGATLTNLREMNEKYAQITSQLFTISELTKNRVILSHKLKGISTIIPDNVWIYEFNIDDEPVEKQDEKNLGKAKVLYLFGFIRAEKEEAFANIQSFIKNLENEPLFVNNVESMKLSSFSKPQSRSLENVMEFKIECQISR